jgi:hypothetical protein
MTAMASVEGKALDQFDFSESSEPRSSFLQEESAFPRERPEQRKAGVFLDILTLLLYGAFHLKQLTGSL